MLAWACVSVHRGLLCLYNLLLFFFERDVGRVCWWHMFHYIFSFPFVSFQCAPHVCKKHDSKSILICESAYFPTRAAGVGLGELLENVRLACSNNTQCWIQMRKCLASDWRFLYLGDCFTFTIIACCLPVIVVALRAGIGPFCNPLLCAIFLPFPVRKRVHVYNVNNGGWCVHI